MDCGRYSAPLSELIEQIGEIVASAMTDEQRGWLRDAQEAQTQAAAEDARLDRETTVLMRTSASPETQEQASTLGRRLLAVALADSYSDDPDDYDYSIATRWEGALARFADTWTEAKGGRYIRVEIDGATREAYTWEKVQPVRGAERTGLTLIRVSDQWVIAYDQESWLETTPERQPTPLIQHQAGPVDTVQGYTNPISAAAAGGVWTPLPARVGACTGCGVPVHGPYIHRGGVFGRDLFCRPCQARRLRGHVWGSRRYCMACGNPGAVRMQVGAGPEYCSPACAVAGISELQITIRIRRVRAGGYRGWLARRHDVRGGRLPQQHAPNGYSPLHHPGAGKRRGPRFGRNDLAAGRAIGENCWISVDRSGIMPYTVSIRSGYRPDHTVEAGGPR